MKKIILSLLTMGVAGVLATAVAQDMPGDGAPPPEMGGGPATVAARFALKVMEYYRLQRAGK